MPKTTKRAATRRAERVARAHTTDLPTLEIKEPKVRRRSPGYKAPARGVARYPWASIIILCLVAIGIFILYANHLGPFAPVKPQPKPVAAAIVTKPAAQSPCLAASILSKITKTSPIPTAADVAKINHTFSGPQQVIDTHKLYCAGINTNRGLMVVELNPDWAPSTVNNFVFLAQHHYYDGLKFHRVIPVSDTSTGLHIVQGGDPKGDGSGGPGYTIAEETQGATKIDYVAGTLAMAKTSAAHSTGSQFFINTTDNKSLPKQYSLFGRVVRGLDVATQIQGPSDTNKNIAADVMYYVEVTPAS